MSGHGGMKTYTKAEVNEMPAAPMKFNLCHPGRTSGEGVWGIPIDDDDHRRMMDSDSINETVKLVLVNEPVSMEWNEFAWWGRPITARTQGNFRACAYREDNLS